MFPLNLTLPISFRSLLQSQTPCLCRILHKSTLNASQAKVMRKVLFGSSKKKNFNFNSIPTLPTTFTLSKGSNEGSRSPNIKRITVLNKLFMRYITDLMSSGECSRKIAGLGIEITRVKIAPDFNYVNVYWYTKHLKEEDKIEDILVNTEGSIRHELTQLRVIGLVPRIKFLKDKTFKFIAEIDSRLAKADFGEDFVPSEPLIKLKTHLELHTKLDPAVREKIEAETTREEYEEPVPDMPQDVFGLNREEIMERITRGMKKSMALHRTCTSEEKPFEVTRTLNTNPVEFSSSKEQKEAFREFLLNREISRSKFKKINEKSSREMLYYQDEAVEDVEEEERAHYDTDFIEEDNFEEIKSK